MEKSHKELQGINDLKLLFFLAVFYTVFELLNLFKNIFFKKFSGQTLEDFPFFIFFIDWFLVIAFMMLIAKNTRYLLYKNYSWKKIFLIHFILAILINTIIRIGIESYQFFQNHSSISELKSSDLIIGFVAHIDTNYLIYFVMLFIIYAYYYLEQIKKTEYQKRIVETELLNTKIRLLSSQLQPHFLFNTINVIIGLIKTDQDKAQNTLVDLSSFLRGTLKLGKENLIELKNELKLLKKYLRIIKTRFDEQLIIKQTIDPQCLNLRIPSLLFQPIIENSIKHGFSDSNEVLVINLTIKKVGDFIDITIRNNGKPLSEHKDVFETGTGISNLNERLKAVYTDGFVFATENFSDDDGNGVITKIKLPFS